jgi:hypothetical protein
VLGFAQAVMAGGPFGFIGRPLQALLPQLVQGPPLLLQVGGRLQGEGQRRRFKGREDPLTDEGLDGLTREIWTIVPTIVGGQGSGSKTAHTRGAGTTRHAASKRSSTRAKMPAGVTMPSSPRSALTPKPPGKRL